MKQVVPLSLFIVLLMPAIGAAQVPRAPGLTRTTISISDGSPSSTILALCYDDQGFLMVGTTSGFVRVDDRRCMWLTTDFEGHVWTLTGMGELVPLSGTPCDPIAPGQVQIHDEMCHVASVRLFATSAGLLAMSRGSDPGKRLFVHAKSSNPDQGQRVGAIDCLQPKPGPSDDMWMGTELRGLQFVENRYVERLDLHPDFPDRPVYHVHQLAGGEVPVNGGQLRAAFLLDGQRNRTPIEVLDAQEYHSTNVGSTPEGTWLSTRGGLARLEGRAIVSDPRWRGAAGPVVASSEGSVWLPFDGRLQQIAAPPGFTGELSSFPLPPSGTDLLCAWRSDFVASSREEVLRLDTASCQWSTMAKLDGAALRQLRPGPSGEIWVSTYGQGLWRIDAGAARSVRFPNLGRGSYTLEVRARTPTSTWSAPARSMTLTVSPLWFDRSWVRWLIAGSALFALQRVILMRMRSLRRRNEMLTEEMNQRWAAEARLVASERRFRRLFHTAPSAILAWTPSGVLLDRNERADNLFAWGHDEVIEGEPWELFEDADVGKDTVHRAFVECEDITVVAMTKAGDFQVKRCRWQFAPTRAESGEVTSIIATISDLSRHDQDARTLAGLRENLARAEESERSRIARELHDDLSQRLAALAIEAQVLDLNRATSDPAATQSVRSFQTEIENVAKHLHTLSRQLHPTIVDDLGLVTALRSECSRRNGTGGTPIALSVDAHVVEPPRDTALALFRIAQEAIRNASRHSGATTIKVALKMSGDWLELSVSDNGKGIRPGGSKSKGGIGMSSMRERARLAGGELHVRSTPGTGTCITAKVPRHPEAQLRAIAQRGE